MMINEGTVQRQTGHDHVCQETRVNKQTSDQCSFYTDHFTLVVDYY